ncbi:MAG TPA: hypothetical protein VHO66_05315 [Ruminiclostridium sp.]|nr:hypothetical protein [Ruminiclostridium sp.]
MLRASSFIVERSRAKSAKEEKYYKTFAIILFLCGLLFLLIPLFFLNGLFILLEGWVLLAVFALAILRPLFYSRGVADVVMALLTGALYAYLCFTIGSNVNSIESFRLGLCAAMLLSGVSRILAYARMVVIVNIPLMLVCGFAEMLSSILIFAGWPGYGVQMIYWFLGMTTILNGFESLSEAAKLREVS